VEPCRVGVLILDDVAADTLARRPQTQVMGGHPHVPQISKNLENVGDCVTWGAECPECDPGGRSKSTSDKLEWGLLHGWLSFVSDDHDGTMPQLPLDVDLDTGLLAVDVGGAETGSNVVLGVPHDPDDVGPVEFTSYGELKADVLKLEPGDEGKVDANLVLRWEPEGGLARLGHGVAGELVYNVGVISIAGVEGRVDPFAN